MRSAAQPHSPPAPPLPLHRVYVCVLCRFVANGSAGMEYNMGYGVQYDPGYAPSPLPPPVPLLGLLPFFSRAHGSRRLHALGSAAAFAARAAAARAAATLAVANARAAAARAAAAPPPSVCVRVVQVR